MVTYYLPGANSARNALCNILCILSFTFFYYGNIGHLYNKYCTGGSFADVTFNLTLMLSASFGYFSVYSARVKHDTINYLFDMIDHNPYYNSRNIRHLQLIKSHNLAQRALIAYCICVALIAILIVEFQTCDMNDPTYTCGYVMPCVWQYLFIIIIQII